MGVKTTFEVKFSVSSSAADEKDLGNGQFSIRTYACEEGGTFRIRIAAGEVDREVCLGNVNNVEFLFVRVNQVSETDPTPAVALKFNSPAGTAINLRPPSDRKEGMLGLTTTGLTSLFVSNAGSFPVELIICSAGLSTAP